MLSRVKQGVWVICAVLMIVVCPVAVAETLVLPTMKILVVPQCEEGEVSCQTVRFSVVENVEKAEKGEKVESGKSREYTGGALHTACADGVTPCHFLGYEFETADAQYRLLESGYLIVRSLDGKSLYTEQGRWQ